MKIWFDMDGTIANLYAVENWLPKLRASDPSPYAEAKVMLNMSLLARYLNKLQQQGHEIGIISWTSKQGTAEYNTAVRCAKLEWLNIHLHSVQFNHIQILEYGTPKEIFASTGDDVLFDDEENNRIAWTGKAYTPDQIFSILSELLRKE